MRGGFDGHRLLAPFGIGLPRLALLGGARRQGQTGNRADTGQRFAAETEADDSLQIVERADFTGGVPRQRQRQIVLADAAAVVANADQLGTAAFNIDIDARCAGVELFSTSSLTTDAGRSTTSPAAIWLASCGGNTDRHAGSCSDGARPAEWSASDPAARRPTSDY